MEEVNALRYQNGGGNKAARETILANVPWDASFVPRQGDHVDKFKEFVVRAYCDHEFAGSRKQHTEMDKKKKKGKRDHKPAKAPAAPPAPTEDGFTASGAAQRRPVRRAVSAPDPFAAPALPIPPAPAGADDFFASFDAPSATGGGSDFASSTPSADDFFSTATDQAVRAPAAPASDGFFAPSSSAAVDDFFDQSATADAGPEEDPFFASNTSTGGGGGFGGAATGVQDGDDFFASVPSMTESRVAPAPTAQGVSAGASGSDMDLLSGMAALGVGGGGGTEVDLMSGGVAQAQATGAGAAAVCNTGRSAVDTSHVQGGSRMGMGGGMGAGMGMAGGMGMGSVGVGPNTGMGMGMGGGMGMGQGGMGMGRGGMGMGGGISRATSLPVHLAPSPGAPGFGFGAAAAATASPPMSQFTSAPGGMNTPGSAGAHVRRAASSSHPARPPRATPSSTQSVSGSAAASSSASTGLAALDPFASM